jgi:hypothetical protein
VSSHTHSQAKLRDVSTPASPHYGRYLSATELADLVAPPAEWLAAVVEWLQSHGVHSHTLSRNRDYITVHVDVGQADALLGCSFGRFLHTCAPHLNANTSSAVRHAQACVTCAGRRATRCSAAWANTRCRLTWRPSSIWSLASFASPVRVPLASTSLRSSARDGALCVRVCNE